MSFKIGHYFYLLMTFLLALFLLLLGIFSTALPWSHFLQTKLIDFITTHTVLLSVFGPGFILVGISLLLYTFLNTKRRYIHIQTGSQPITIDESVIHQYLETYWQEQFPKSHIPSHLTFKKNSIEIVADLPYLPKQDQKVFLEQVKTDFSDLFGRFLGSQHTIHFIASFDAAPPKK